MECALGFDFRAVFSPDSAVGTGLRVWWSSAIATPQLWAAAGWMFPKLSWWQLMTRNKKEFFGGKWYLILENAFWTSHALKQALEQGCRDWPQCYGSYQCGFDPSWCPPDFFFLNPDDAKGKKSNPPLGSNGMVWQWVIQDNYSV